VCRRCAYVALKPLDRLSLVINGKKDFPPLHLRRYVGPLRSFEMSGAEFMSYLRLIVNLQPDESLLDIGCGCGLMAIPLQEFLSRQARYEGLDVHEPSITWCRRHISSKHPNFKFRHIDVKSHAFNRRGRYAAEEFSFPYEDQAFDVILLKSVFTHMRPPAVDNYCRELSRLLSPKGRCLATFFLLNDRQKELAKTGGNKLHFNFGDDTWRYVYQNSPDSAVAYREDFVHSMLQKHGLSLRSPIIYGSWSGLSDGLSFQDMLLLQKQ